MAGRPPLYDTPEALEAAIEDYFNPRKKTIEQTQVGTFAAEGEREPRENVTITGLALHLGFESRQSFYDYEEREGFSYIVKRARLRVEMAYEERLSANSPTGAIFALKNMGWKDKTEVDQNHTGAMPVILQETKTYLNK